MAFVSATQFTVLLGLVAFYLLHRLRRSSKSVLPLPPGPKGIPILGNLTDLPQPGMLECHHWLKHKDLYGAYRCIRRVMQQLNLRHLLLQVQSVPLQCWAKHSSLLTIPKSRSSLCGTVRLFTHLDLIKCLVERCRFNQTEKHAQTRLANGLGLDGRMRLL